MGCSSHSERKTFFTHAAQKIINADGSHYGVQALAGHFSLTITQRYMNGESEARRKVVDMLLSTRRQQARRSTSNVSSLIAVQVAIFT
jgi:hypothetical protein